MIVSAFAPSASAAASKNRRTKTCVSSSASVGDDLRVVPYRIRADTFLGGMG